MPEGDTLLRTAQALNNHIAGRVCIEASPAPFTRLSGQCVDRVESHGKHLYIWFESGLGIHSHLRMRGTWHLYGVTEGWHRPERERRVSLCFENVTAVLFSAPTVEIVSGNERTAHLGPDILGDGFEVADAVRHTRAAPSKHVGEMLLDQRICAGIGNIYRCESLWHLGLSPWTATGDIDDETLAALFAQARRLMLGAAREVPGANRRAVHGRAGRSCPRCAERIAVRGQGEQARMTFWCPNCQRELLPDQASTRPTNKQNG